MSTNKSPVHSFGWIPDKKSSKDYQYSTIQATVATKSEDSVRALFPPAYDQKALGSCVGHATKGLMSAAYARQGAIDPVLSALMIYFSAREIEEKISEDSGCSPRDALKAASKLGVCTESLWPYVIERFADRPTQECYADALNHQIISYYSVLPVLSSIKSCIAEGYPLSAGIVVFENYPRVTTTGEFPSPKGEALGGHDIDIVGYSDIKERLYIRNSWGTEWGDNGYGSIPYEYINPELMGDLWTIRMMETVDLAAKKEDCVTAFLRSFNFPSKINTK